MSTPFEGAWTVTKSLWNWFLRAFYIDEMSIRVYNIAIVVFLRTNFVFRIFKCFAVAGRAWTACFDIEVDNRH